jgi:transcription-repair coupling factor (superfamily II helicase)
MYERAQINPVKIPEMLGRFGDAMSFKKAEPVQFIYEIKNNRQNSTGNLLELTGRILDDMEILLEE